jgi:hypothetical protein
LEIGYELTPALRREPRFGQRAMSRRLIPLKVFLDSNVFGDIDRTGSLELIRSLFRRQSVIPIAGVENLAEALRIAKSDERIARIRVMTGLIRSRFEIAPTSYMCAQEALSEIRRWRPAWLRPKDTQAMTLRLRRTKEIWSELRVNPDYLAYETVPGGFSMQEVSAGLGQIRESQKRRHDRIRAGLAPVIWGIKSDELRSHLSSVVSRLPDEEKWWRFQSAATIWQGLQGVRDQADLHSYLSGQLATETIDRERWAEFWLAEVDATRVPALRATHLTSYLQLSKSPQASNSFDSSHAPRLLTVDVFLTADRDFYEILTGLRSRYLPEAGLPVLLRGALKNPELAFSQAIAEARQILSQDS